MLTKTFRWVSSTGIAAGMLLGSAAVAQSSEPLCSMGFNYSTGYGSIYSSKLPYSATAKSSFEQKLSDGSYIRAYAISHQARDSSGKTKSELGESCHRGEDGQPELQYSVSVFDPVTKTSMSWQVNSYDLTKVVSVYHQPATSSPKPLTTAELEARRKMQQARQLDRKEYKTEDLGIRSFAGIEAHGRRTTRTIPAGEEGNELPLSVINETWTSKELGLVMMAIVDDPRHGRTTFEIQELTQGEPDPSLFLPPSDYKIEDRSPVVAANAP